MECHLEEIWFDDKEGVRCFQVDVNLQPRRRVDLLFEVEAPDKAAASDDGLILRERLADTLALAEAKGSHAFDVGKYSQWLLVCRPAGLKPALRTEVVWIWIFDGIAKERPDNREC